MFNIKAFSVLNQEKGDMGERSPLLLRQFELKFIQIGKTFQMFFDFCLVNHSFHVFVEWKTQWMKTSSHPSQVVVFTHECAFILVKVKMCWWLQTFVNLPQSDISAQSQPYLWTHTKMQMLKLYVLSFLRGFTVLVQAVRLELVARDLIQKNPNKTKSSFCCEAGEEGAAFLLCWPDWGTQELNVEPVYTQTPQLERKTGDI